MSCVLWRIECINIWYVWGIFPISYYWIMLCVCVCVCVCYYVITSVPQWGVLCDILLFIAPFFSPVPPGRGPIQLWQFLLDLLISPDKAHLIQWTGNGYEFHIAQPEEIAKLWGARKNKPRMNYDKLSRGLRYYYSKGIMDKVPGKKLTFKYTCDIQQYIIQRAKSSGSSPVSAGMLVN